MDTKLTVVIIGLPLFAKRLAKQLSAYKPEGKYIALDTYYSKRDKILALWWIRKADIVFSINGSLETSKIFDYTLKLGKPLVMNWVGTDVIFAKKQFNNKKIRQDYVNYAIHLCEVDWIKEELFEIGIDAKILNFACFDKVFKTDESFKNHFAVLNYIPEDRKSFYGIDLYIELAKLNPTIHFYIAGCMANEYVLPVNILPLGWVSDMNDLYLKVQVCIRIPEHDGLSTFVLEGLARGKQVIYKYQYPNVFQLNDIHDIDSKLKEFQTKWLAKQSLINLEGMNYISEHFNSNFILSNLLSFFYNLTGNKYVNR